MKWRGGEASCSLCCNFRMTVEHLLHVLKAALGLLVFCCCLGMAVKDPFYTVITALSSYF